MLEPPVVPVEAPVVPSVVSSVPPEVELDEPADPEPVLAPELEPEVSSGPRVASTDEVEPEVVMGGTVDDEVEPPAVVDAPPSPSPGLESGHAVNEQTQIKTRARMPDAIASWLANAPLMIR